MHLVLLASLPESGWDEIRQQLGDFALEPEQQAFGGTPADFVDLEREPDRHVFLIYVEDELVGVGSLLTGPVSAALWPLQTPAIQLRGFVIDLKMHGRGIGTIATKKVIRLAKTIDPSATHLTLTVNQRNPGARMRRPDSRHCKSRIWEVPLVRRTSCSSSWSEVHRQFRQHQNKKMFAIVNISVTQLVWAVVRALDTIGGPRKRRISVY